MNDDLAPHERSELEWWRHFASKLSPDSRLPRVGSPLLGWCWKVVKVDRNGEEVNE